MCGRIIGFDIGDEYVGFLCDVVIVCDFVDEWNGLVGDVDKVVVDVIVFDE